MNTPKRHHVVPQMIVRNFLDQNNVLWCLKKDEGTVFSSTARNAFVYTNLYTNYGYTGRLNDATKENLIATQIEAPADRVVKKITSSARADRKPNLTVEEKHIWDNFLHAQVLRTAYVRSLLNKPEIVHGYIGFLERKLGTLPERAHALLKGTSNEPSPILLENWLKLILNPVGNFYEALRGKGLIIQLIKNPRKAFITGSVPTLLHTPHRGTFKQSGILLIPIASDVAVASFGYFGDENLWPVPQTNRGTDYIRFTNLEIRNQSNIVGCRSRKLVESLRGKYK